MEIKYSKTPFEGFTHRFIIRISIDEDWRNDTSITLYSNSDSYQELENFINIKLEIRFVLLYFRILHYYFFVCFLINNK